jgi:uncharacterized membrane protein YphA (DoxX/SURF4 family)
MQAGWNKFQHFEDTISWFGNSDWGLGLPFPEILAFFATSIELIGGGLLLIGLFTRIVALPMAITMFVAAITVHLENGWLAIADPSSWLADGTLYYDEKVMASIDKKEEIQALIENSQYSDWLTSSGNVVILNNGIEFAATYFIMCLILLVFGAGRFVSADFFIAKKLGHK